MTGGNVIGTGRFGGARRAMAAVAAVAFVCGAARADDDGDVGVTRAGNAVFVRGGSTSDEITFSSPAAGVLRIEADGPGTTVGGGAFTEIDLQPRDTVYILLDGGSNRVTVEGLPAVRQMVLIGGTGADNLTFRSGDFPAGVHFDGQGGADTLVLEPGAVIRDDVVAILGEGSDAVTANDAAITGAFIVDLGSGDANFVALTGVTLGESVDVFGGDGFDQVSVLGGSVRRAARFDLGGGDNQFAISGEAHVRGGFRCITAGGNDTVALGESRFDGQVRIDAGDGNDTIEFSAVTVARRAQVFCGSGGDTVAFDDANPADFESSSRIDGGEGRDALDGTAPIHARVVRFESAL